MKKNFVKKLALAMALVVTATSVNVPAASAAATPGFKSEKVTVNVGQTKKYSTANSSNYSVEFKIGNTKVATIKNSKGSKSIKVTGVAEGKTTLRADFTSKKTNKVTTAKVPVTVKAITVSITGDNNFVTAVNEKYTLTGTLSGKTSAKVYWSVAEEGAAVDDNGVFTATKAGEYNVTADVKTADGSVIATATQKVTVKDVVLKSVAQESVTTLTAVFTGDVSKVKNSDIVIKRTSDNVVFPVSKVVPDTKDASKLTFVTFSKMNDGKEYTVTFADTTLSFTATEGKAVSLVVDPVTVPYNQETPIHVLGKDANGITVFDYTDTNKDSKLDIDVTITKGTGYMTGDNLVLLEKGDTAKITATLHTYTYNTDGTEKDVLKTEATITAVDPEAVSFSSTKYTVASSLDWTKTTNTKTAIGDSDFLYYVLKDAKGNDVTGNYTVAVSSDENILLASYTAAGTVTLTPVKTGTAYVLIKDNYNNVVASFPVTVVAEREASSLTLSQVSVTLSNELADTATVYAILKDQYGDKMNFTVAPTVTQRTNALPAGGNLSVPGITPNGVITIATTTATVKGTYVFDVSYGDFKAVLSVTVQEANNAIGSTYKVSLSKSTVDTTISRVSAATDVAIQVSAAEYKGNVKVSNADVTDIKVFDSKGKAVTSSAIDLTDGSEKIVVAKYNAGRFTKVLKPGTYTAVVTFNDNSTPVKSVVARTSFTVEDNQTGVTYVVNKSTVAETDITAALKNTNNIRFYYNGGVELNATAANLTVVEEVVNGKVHGGIVVSVDVTVGAYTVPVYVALNQTITCQ